MYKINNSQPFMKHKARQYQPSVSPSTQHLQYINILDKCSQILRDDRIWLRNQIKTSNQAVIQIFKTSKKPINIQHLQIRLRKYVASIKSQAKMEQLTKFKQNLLMGEVAPDPIKKRQPQPCQKNKNESFSSTLTLKNILKQSYSWKPNLRNQSFNSRKNQTSYSGKSLKKQHLNSHSISKKWLDNIKKDSPQELKQNRIFKQQIANSEHANNYFQNQIYKKPLRQWQIETANQNKLYQYTNPTQYFGKKDDQRIDQKGEQHQIQLNEYQQSNQRQGQRQEDIESVNIYNQKNQEKDQYLRANFNGGYSVSDEKRMASDLEWMPTDSLFTPPQFLNECKRFIQQQKSVSGKKDHLENHFQMKAQTDSPPRQEFRLDSIINNCNQTQTKNYHYQAYPRVYNQSKNYQNQSYSIKDVPDYIDKGKFVNFQSIGKPDRTQFEKLSKISLNQSEKQYQQSKEKDKGCFQYMYPSDNSNPKLSQHYGGSPFNLEAQRNIQNQDHLSFRQIYQKYANYQKQHSGTHQEHQDLQIDQRNTPKNQDQKSRQIVAQSYSIQEVLDRMIQCFEGNNIRQKDFLSALPKQMIQAMNFDIQPDEDQWLNILGVVSCLSDSFGLEKSSESNPTKDVYNLLDIDQKGFINMGDIESFLTQLEDAGIQCLEELSAKLWRIYQNSEEEGRLEYWALYILKDDQQFNEVCGILEQFQFEVQI